MAEHAAVLGVLAVNRSNKVEPADTAEVTSLYNTDMEYQGGTTLIKLNISGQSITVSQRLVDKYPSSKLAASKELEKHWSEELKAYYFDRDPILFNAVLNIFRYDALLIPPGYDKSLLMAEIAYWNIPFIDKNNKEVDEEERLEKEFLTLENRFPPPKNTDSKIIKWRHQAWCFITDPFGPHTKYRKLSLAYSVFTISAVFFYLIIHGLSTSVYYREDNGARNVKGMNERIDGRPPPNISRPTTTTEAANEVASEGSTALNPGDSMMELRDKIQQLGCSGEDKMDCFLKTMPRPWIDYTKIAFICLFTFETLLRLVLCPGLAYFKSIVNWIDIIATACVVCTVGVGRHLQTTDHKTRSLGFTFELLQSLQVLRVFKVFQYATVLDGLMVIMLTIRACLKELALLVLYLMLAMFLFSTLISFVELSGESGTGIPDVLHGYWWAIITMTTVGYGDYYPTTTIGYLIGIMCAITGIIMTALPVAVIGSNFNMYWQHNKKRQAVLMAAIKRESRFLNNSSSHDEERYAKLDQS